MDERAGARGDDDDTTQHPAILRVTLVCYCMVVETNVVVHADATDHTEKTR